MTNTMKDLRREVQKRLHNTLDGKEIDMMKGVTPETPHMIGVTSLNAIHTHHSEDGTLLDPTIEFWQEYEEAVNTKSKAEEKIQSAIRSLKEDDVFSMTYPYGEEADIVYCEIDPVERKESTSNTILKSPCPKCGTEIQTSPLLELGTGSGFIKVSVDCEECDFSGSYQTVLHKV